MSDILIEYAKIAEQHGLIKKAQETKNDNVRYDSVPLSDIGLLYGVEPNGKEDHIFDQAHPETVIVGRSYDAMNAVIETPQQRQSIMSSVALKTPNGNQTQRRYIDISHKLTQSLINAGFATEGRNEKLMRLADSCAERQVKRLEKKAYAHAVIGGAIAAIGLIYYFGYSATSAATVAKNAGWVLEALTPLESQPYAPTLSRLVENIKVQSERFYANKNRLVARSMEQIVEKSQDAETQKMVKHMQGYYNQLKQLKIAIPKIVENIKLTHAEEEANETIFGKFTWEPYETLIDRLYGQGNWFSKGRTGGLYQAIENEIKALQAASKAAQANRPLINKVLMQNPENIQVPTQPTQPTQQIPQQTPKQTSQPEKQKPMFNIPGLEPI
jgi:hypothetical protein